VNRLSIAATIAVLTVVGLPTNALADNWGAADWGNTQYSDGEPPGYLLCSTPDSHPENYRKGECSANNNNPHIVWISDALDGVQPDLGNALRVSIEKDYDSIDGVYAREETNEEAFADARVHYGTINANWEIAFTFCQVNASFLQSGYRYHMSCTPQRVQYQDTADGRDCWASGACRKHYACHELGHTLGLQHPNGLYNPDTCMGYASSHPHVLKIHDEQHLVNCYPKPLGQLAAWWHETRSAVCED
jgi:hypothetical protein